VPTIGDVAAKAGVGVGTVSRVLNNSTHVSPDTRARVQKAIAELGYRPSAAARALSSGRSSAVPVFSANITLPSVVARLQGIFDAVDDDHELVMCQVRSPEQRAEFVTRHAGKLPAFGVLSISLLLDEEEVAVFRDSAVPVVSVDYLTPGVPSIVIDDVAAARTATEYLIDLGHRDIAFLGDRPQGDYRTRATEERRSAYREALAAAGVDWEPRLEADVVDSKRKAAAELLGRTPRPTAVFADADSTALCVLAVARSMGLSVPTDLSVMGFDDLWAAYAAGLTTVAQPLEMSGQMAAGMLAAAAAGDELPEVTTLETRLVVRETTAPPR
jgi:DNA-binding LacI/PurR family transcriptional regulator